MRIPMPYGGYSLCYSVQVPLTPKAIQINILVPPGRDKEADDLMNELLASLQGPTNWDTGSFFTSPALLVGGSIGLLIGLRRIYRHS